MKKKIVSLLLGLVLCVSVVACSSGKTSNVTDEVLIEEGKAKFEMEGATYIELSDNLIMVDVGKIDSLQEVEMIFEKEIKPIYPS